MHGHTRHCVCSTVDSQHWRCGQSRCQALHPPGVLSHCLLLTCSFVILNRTLLCLALRSGTLVPRWAVRVSVISQAHPQTMVLTMASSVLIVFAFHVIICCARLVPCLATAHSHRRPSGNLWLCVCLMRQIGPACGLRVHGQHSSTLGSNCITNAWSWCDHCCSLLGCPSPVSLSQPSNFSGGEPSPTSFVAKHSHVQVLDYPSVQQRVLPLVSVAYALHFTGAYMKRIYREYLKTKDADLLREVPCDGVALC
jgi:hypothetical protein